MYYPVNNKRPYQTDSKPDSTSAPSPTKRLKIEPLQITEIPELLQLIIDKISDVRTLASFHQTCKTAAEYTEKCWKKFSVKYGYDFSFAMTQHLSEREKFTVHHVVHRRIRLMLGLERTSGTDQMVVDLAGKAPLRNLSLLLPGAKPNKQINQDAKVYAGESALKAITTRIPNDGLNTKTGFRVLDLFARAVENGMKQASFYAFITMNRCYVKAHPPEVLKKVADMALRSAAGGFFETLELALRNASTSPYLQNNEATYPPFKGIKGDKAMNSGNYEEAVYWYEDALQNYGEIEQSTTSYYFGRLAIAYSKLEKHLEALKYLQKVDIRFFPQEFSQEMGQLHLMKETIYSKAANQFFEMGNYKEALKLYIEVHMRCASDSRPGIVARIAYCHHQVGDFKNALTNCKELEKTPLRQDSKALFDAIIGDVTSQFKNAYALCQDGNFQEAIIIYERLRTICWGAQKKRLEAHLAMAYYHAGKDLKALRILHDLKFNNESLVEFSLFPSEAEMNLWPFFENKATDILNKANHLLDQKKYKKAGNRYLRLLKLDLSKNFSRMIRAHLIQVYYHLNDFHHALFHLEIIENDEPSNDQPTLEQEKALLEPIRSSIPFKFYKAGKRLTEGKFSEVIEAYKIIESQNARLTNQGLCRRLVHLAYSYTKLGFHQEGREYALKALDYKDGLNSELSDLLREIDPALLN